MTTRNFIKALESLRPDGYWHTPSPSPEYEDIVWIDGSAFPVPTKKQFEKALLDVALLEYKDKRRIEYPDIGDQLDALFHAGVFPEEMAAKIQAVKDKYPKP